MESGKRRPGERTDRAPTGADEDRTSGACGGGAGGGRAPGERDRHDDDGVSRGRRGERQSIARWVTAMADSAERHRARDSGHGVAGIVGDSVVVGEHIVLAPPVSSRTHCVLLPPALSFSSWPPRSDLILLWPYHFCPSQARRTSRSSVWFRSMWLVVPRLSTFSSQRALAPLCMLCICLVLGSTSGFRLAWYHVCVSAIAPSFVNTSLFLRWHQDFFGAAELNARGSRCCDSDPGAPCLPRQGGQHRPAATTSFIGMEPKRCRSL